MSEDGSLTELTEGTENDLVMPCGRLTAKILGDVGRLLRLLGDMGWQMTDVGGPRTDGRCPMSEDRGQMTRRRSLSYGPPRRRQMEEFRLQMKGCRRPQPLSLKKVVFLLLPSQFTTIDAGADKPLERPFFRPVTIIDYHVFHEAVGCGL